MSQMGEMGLFGLPFPEQYGGMGGDLFVLCFVFEELVRVDQSVATAPRQPESPRSDAHLPVRQ